MGLFYTCFYVGMTGLPPIAGWLRDFSGSAAMPHYLRLRYHALDTSAVRAVSLSAGPLGETLQVGTSRTSRDRS